MENKYSYYKWFQKVMSVFIDAFFIVAPLASLYVFTSFLTGYIRIAAYIFLIAVYGLIVYLFKDRIRYLISGLLKKIDDLDTRKMIIIITITAIVLKVIFTIFFNYDGTKSGDTKIYNDIAEQIIQTGDIHSSAISHLYALALHFVVFKLLIIPLHVGFFISIYIGVIVNFLSFKDIIGKNKAFLASMIYLLMPSTVFFTFCPTHEVFVFMYISLFLFFFNRMIREDKTGLMVVDACFVVISTVLTCFVNPGGYIILIIMLLCILLSNIRISKKSIIAVCLVITLFCSNSLSRFLNVNKYNTTINTYTILIHGVNPNSLGEQEDGYPLRQMRKYLYENTLDFSEDGFIDAAKHVLIEHYIYLITHPAVLIRLIAHKIYILWSGVHYPIELAHFYHSIEGPLYYAVLAVNTLIYLFVLSVGMFYFKKNEDEIYISNYKLEFLGVIALTMFCIVVNKYSVYVTLFLYMICFYRAEFEKE